jgi:hypothetical protein
MKAQQGLDSKPTVEAGLPELSAAGAAGLRMWLDANRSFAAGLAVGQGELVSFWQARLECWRDTATRLAACREPQEALRIQAEFGEEMIRAYSAFWPKMMGLMVGIAADLATQAETTAAPSADPKMSRLPPAA